MVSPYQTGQGATGIEGRMDARADLTFCLALEIRNRLLDAYQEVTRMQVRRGHGRDG